MTLHVDGVELGMESLAVETGEESPEEHEEPMAPSEPTTPTKRGVTFSFDSSGWLYTYHLGVAHCLQQQLLGRGSDRRADFAFSGSSGGALVAAALATDIDVKELAAFVIDCQAECQYNPWNMCARLASPCVAPPAAQAHRHAQAP